MRKLMIVTIIVGAITVTTLFTVALARESLPEEYDYTVYLPVVMGGNKTPISVTVPLSRVYESISTGSITSALAMEFDVAMWEYAPAQQEIGTVAVMCPMGICSTPMVDAHVKRAVLVFDDTSSISWTNVLSAEVRFSTAFYASPPFQPNVPLLVSQTELTTRDARETFSGGNHGEEWKWWLAQVEPDNTLPCDYRLPIPIDQITPGNSTMSLFLRSGVEERPDLWPGDDMLALPTMFVHQMTWGRVVCPTGPRVPQLVLWMNDGGKRNE